MTLKNLTSCVVVALSATAINVAASEFDKMAVLDHKVEQMEMNQSLEKERQEKLNWALATAKSKKALLALSSQNSPLDKLSSHNRQAFIDSIVFRENGIAGFNMAVLENELNAVEAYKVLSLIGAQHYIKYLTNIRVESTAGKILMGVPSVKPDGWEYYECIKHGTCAPTSKKYICTKNC